MLNNVVFKILSFVIIFCDLRCVSRKQILNLRLLETLYIADNYYEKSLAFSMVDNVNKFLSAGFFAES